MIRMLDNNYYFLHAKLDYGMANNFSRRRSFEPIFLPTGRLAIRSTISSTTYEQSINQGQFFTQSLSLDQ